MIFKLFLIKEIKKFPLFFLLLLVTLLLGTLGLTGISVVSEQVKEKLESNARELLTSDIVVSARRDLLDDEKLQLEKIIAPIPHKTYKIVDIYSMVRHEKTSQTRLTEVRSLENGFPYYGEIKLREGKFQVDGLYISKDLADLWSIATGDDLKVGEKIFTVKGIVQNDSSQGMRGFSLAPRIYLPLSEVEQTGLLKPGATGSYARHYRIESFKPEDFEVLRKNLLNAIPDSAVKVTLPQESSEQSGRVIGYLTDFMSLAALIGLLLSLVGTFYLYQSHLVARLKDFCLFNLLGLDKKHIIMGLILQFTLVFALVFLIQSILIVPGYKILQPLLTESLGMELSPEVNLKSVFSQLPFLYGLTLAILIPLLFGLMRTPMGLQLKAPKISMGRFRFYDFFPFIGLLWGFAVYISHSWKIGSLFFGALLVVFVLSTGLIKLVQWSLKKYVKNRSLLMPSIEAGVAIRNIIHSGHKLTLSFLSLAMGATLISLILQLDRLIQKEFTLDESKPSLFIFDIQEDQMEPLQAFAATHGVKLEGITPMIRARLEKVNDKAFTRTESRDSLRTREEEGEERIRNRGINLTYRQNLTPAENLVAGEPFPETRDNTDRPVYVSLEKRFAQRMDLSLGDKVTFDIQGVPVEGIVRNFREVKWTSFYPNFFVNLEPGFIEEAPKTYLAVLPAQGNLEVKRNFQREAVGQFPNISFIDVEELISKLAMLFEKSRQAIEVISILSLGVGLVILYGLSHDQVYRRYYDLALMKTLGFSSGSLRKHLLIEFGFLFLLAMSIGFLLGWLMAVIIGREAFKLDPSIDWSLIFYPGLFLSILCLVTILLSSWKAVRAKPRELLSDS